MTRIVINLAAQTLVLSAAVRHCYTVSTAANGAGELRDSHQTPRGRHVIRAKIGAGAPINTVFRGRRPSGEQYSPQLAKNSSHNDWILTRILWLGGLQPEKNRGGRVDTLRRYIYIHGTPDSTLLGVPGSIGCIRMRNIDIVELFDLVKVGERVDIIENDEAVL